jgi:hypothetical protein
MNKILKWIGMGLLVLATVFMFANVANSQTRMRDWLCDIFLCTRFTELENKVINIEAELALVKAQNEEIKNLLLAFDTTEIAKKIDLALTPEAAIWMQHNRTEGNREFIDVYMKGEALAEYKAFGLDFVYDATGFDYIGITRGPLFNDFAMFDSNEIEDGRIRWGAVAGTARGIVGTTVCLVATLEIQRNAEGPTTVHLENLVDDIADLRPIPTHLTFE